MIDNSKDTSKSPGIGDDAKHERSKNQSRELKREELDKVSGGLNPQPLPPREPPRDPSRM